MVEIVIVIIVAVILKKIFKMTKAAVGIAVFVGLAYFLCKQVGVI